MPRGPRLDAPGTLYHVIVRGIERREIVDDDMDREEFVTRMGPIALDTEKIELHCKSAKVAVGMLQSGSRRPPLPKLRRAIALKLINEYGVSLAETARRLGISTSGVAQILKRSAGG